MGQRGGSLGFEYFLLCAVIECILVVATYHIAYAQAIYVVMPPISMSIVGGRIILAIMLVVGELTYICAAFGFAGGGGGYHGIIP